MNPAPGPVEAAILADLAPTFRVRFVDTPGGALRILEGGDGPPLVLLHGRGAAATSWFPLLPRLARHHRVLAVDLPGFGASRGHRFHGGGGEAGLAFFVDPVEAWIAAEGLAAPAIAGHSLGGLVTLELALRKRAAPRAIALFAPMGVGPDVSLAARLFFHAGPERLARLLGRDRFVRIQGAPTPRAGDLAHELNAVPGGRPDAGAAFNTLAPLAGPPLHRLDRLREVGVPVLLIAGERDEVFPAPRMIAAAAAMPQADLRILPLGHSPHLEGPDEVGAALAAFLGTNP